ncbi:glutathione binding-like protein, partial [Mesorhizobium sp. M7A.F.Ca.US.001.02.1.1]
PYIAVRKALLTFPERAGDATPERLAVTLERGNKALSVMNRHLENNAFFAGSALSVADIALYAYTHTAEQGGFQLDAYPAVSAWLGRVEADPGHVPIEWVG